MPQLAVGVDFLAEFAKLQPPVRRQTVEALTKFSEHTHAGLHLEKLANMRDERVRTIRITDYWRGVVLAPASGDRYVLLRVMGHDEAVEWAQRRVFSVNEVSGVLEVRDVAAIEELAERETAPAAEPLFAKVGDNELSTLGVDVQVRRLARTLTDVDALAAIEPFVPANQYEVLFWLAEGIPVEQVWADVVAPRLPDGPIDKEDVSAAAERSRGRIALVDGPDDLMALLDKPLALWRVFLHPTQEELAYRPSYAGSAQVTGGPGTGKTVVALHRVKHLASSRELPRGSILLTTFTRGLAESLELDVETLLDTEQRRAVQVLNVDRWALGVVRAEHGTVTIADDEQLRGRLPQAGPFTPAFLLDEWRQVVLANAVTTGEEYLTAPRRGRGKGLGRPQKQQVWAVLREFAEGLRRDRLWTFLTVADEAARLLAARPSPPFRHVVVDEIQDLHPAQWRLLRAAVAPGPDDLFLTGDPHQRIYGNHVSLQKVGIGVRGRSAQLRLNYRTTAEILHWSMRVLGDATVADLDDGYDSLTGYRSALHGEPPEVAPAATVAQEGEELALAIEQWREDGVAPGDIVVVARTLALARGVAKELKRHGVRTAELRDERPPADAVRVGTMHGMKGLEFRCVAIVAASERNLPHRRSITPVAEDPVRHALDVRQERCLLFVACTRARERLRVSWSGTASELVPA
ncbi:UvrD-helicase domain-containing protein [Pseudonocardia lacus]|uniref:UvrD-helicase domain-containing protein n=1 Tax=Pseudonocardia lacus TaxID=2835865 RepID=UPI001BDD7DBC|nr:UvrD-helicase domain-containing protein [Pseudonocardia lacus]